MGCVAADAPIPAIPTKEKDYTKYHQLVVGGVWDEHWIEYNHTDVFFGYAYLL